MFCKTRRQKLNRRAACRCLATASLPEPTLSSTDIDRGLAKALHKLGTEVGRQSGAAFVRRSALTEPPGADQSDGAGVGVGVGVTVADGSGEGDSPAVEKFRPSGEGAWMNWRGSIVFD